jgi:hypothetical protein
MNLSFALPKSPESPAAGGALEGRNARKTEGSQARDGFSEMLDQLASFIPANAEGDGALPDRQAQDLPGGKELPGAAYAGRYERGGKPGARRRA